MPAILRPLLTARAAKSASLETNFHHCRWRWCKRRTHTQQWSTTSAILSSFVCQHLMERKITRACRTMRSRTDTKRACSLRKAIGNDLLKRWTVPMRGNGPVWKPGPPWRPAGRTPRERSELRRQGSRCAPRGEATIDDPEDNLPTEWRQELTIASGQRDSTRCRSRQRPPAESAAVAGHAATTWHTVLFGTDTHSCHSGCDLPAQGWNPEDEIGFTRRHFLCPRHQPGQADARRHSGGQTALGIHRVPRPAIGQRGHLFEHGPHRFVTPRPGVEEEAHLRQLLHHPQPLLSVDRIGEIPARMHADDRDLVREKEIPNPLRKSACRLRTRFCSYRAASRGAGGPIAERSNAADREP